MAHLLQNAVEKLESIAQDLGPKVSVFAKRILSVVDELEQYIEDDNASQVVLGAKIRAGLSEEGRERIVEAQKKAWTPQRKEAHSKRMKELHASQEVRLEFSARSGGSWLVEGWEEIERQSGIKRSKIKHYLKPGTYNLRHLQFFDEFGELITISRPK